MMIQFLVLLSLSLFCVGESVHNLTFMFVTSFGQSGFNASGVVPAADIALEDINSHPDVLQGYHLMYDKVRDSQCHRERSLDTFFEGILSNPPTKLAVVGCGCSVATEPVAEISHQWNISLISYASSSPTLSERSRFRSFFRNTYNMKIIAPAFRSAVAHFNWTRIAIITQNEGLFTGTESDVKEEFRLAGIAVESQTFETSEQMITIIEDMLTSEEDHRIFFVNTFSGPARDIICYAQSHNHVYPNYAWIFYDWYQDGWWTMDVSGAVFGGCRDSELAGFLDRAITIKLPDVSNKTTDIGTSLTVFMNEYEERAKRGNYMIINQAYRLYDVLWVLALALNDTIAMIDCGDDISGTGCNRVSGSLVPLEEFDYSNKKMGCLIQWNIQQTDFYGLTGRVHFDENGTRIIGNIVFQQYHMKGGQLVKRQFAYVDETANYTFMFDAGFDDDDVFPGGAPPDGTPSKVIHTFKIGLVATFYILASLGILFAIACLIFNIVFRSRKIVRLSSPTLNYFIIAGTIFMYASIFFFLLPANEMEVIVARCVVEHWLFTIGYSLAFGAVFVKMWRVYQIFHNPQPNKRILTDWKLIIIVLVIVLVAVFLLLLGEAIPFLRRTVVLKDDPEHGDGRNVLGVREKSCVWICQEVSTPGFYWKIVIFAYLVIFQIIGIMLAFQTRKVRLRGLRDSKEIAAIIYISSITIVVMALLTFALVNYINVGTAIFVVGIFLLTTTFLILIFIPKMIFLYKDPKGKSLSVTHSQTGSVKVASKLPPQNNKSVTDLEKKVASLERAKQEGEKTIAELRQRINALIKEQESVMEKENHDVEMENHSTMV